jgi:hypothetical protein
MCRWQECEGSPPPVEHGRPARSRRRFRADWDQRGHGDMAIAPALQTVTWRQTVAAVVAVALGLAGLVFVLRSEGLPALDAASSRATRWVVHEPSGRVVLVDGFGGRALASLDLNAQGSNLFVAEGSGQAFVIDDSTAEVRSIDSVDLRLGPSQALASLGDGFALARAGSSGLVVANPLTGDATLVPTGGDPVDLPFEADTGPGVDRSTTIALAPDGSVWSLNDGALQRANPATTTREALGLDGGALSLVGNEALVVDRDRGRVRYGTGDWQTLPGSFDGSEFVVQRPGPQAPCGWVGAGEFLWCVGPNGIDERAEIPNLDIGGGDVLAIAGDAAALVRRGPTEVVQFDWRGEQILDEQPVTVFGTADLEVTATTDVIWIDDRSGDFVWSVHPWGIEAIDKDATGLLVLGEEGDVVEDGQGAEGEAAGADDGVALAPEDRQPDNNGFDDPPVAVDDPATARAGASVPVAVTANDYDPDGEAIAVSEVGAPGHGTAEVGTATTVVYTPEPGYVGLDEFDYTIVDGDGTEATATVFVELLPTDGTNRPPVGAPDEAETGAGVGVVVDVLLNDVDPERDGLRLDSFSATPEIGEVNVAEGPSGLPALEYTPADGFEGTAQFSYQPADTFGAVGEAVEVDVEVARAGDENRPPDVQPDSVRTRRYTESIVPVLVNDSDPDGDPLTLSVERPLPDGVDVEVQGDQLGVTPLAGSGDSVTFEYMVDDGRGHRVVGSVLVDVIDESEPNRPPVVSADIETVVVGQTILIDVTANDSDPDGDPLAIVAITQPESGGAVSAAGRNQIEFTPSGVEVDEDEDANVRFTYTVSDGNDHEVAGDVTVTVLAEALPEPPYAQDDSTFTFVDDSVTIDVLRNDGDPSGERPTIVGRPGCPSGGTATVAADGQVRYNPPSGQSGAFRCTYEVTNSQNLRDSAAIIISVREPEISNESPRANNDPVTINVGDSVTVDVTENDSDPDGDDRALRVTSSTEPPFGVASRNGNFITFGSATTIGVATITYQVEDDEGALATGRLQVTVTEAANVAPTARPDTRQIEGPGVATTFDVLVNDSDPDQTDGGLRVISAQLATGDGLLSQAGPTITITPNPDFVGTLTGIYTIEDGEGLPASSTVTLTVTEPANRQPAALDDSGAVANGASLTVPVLLNDSDPDGDPLTVSIISGPDASLGTASVTGTQEISFSARAGQSGTANIAYQVSDGELTDSATLRITVATCQASFPVANSAQLQTGYQQPIAVNLADFAANGDVSIVNAPSGYVNGIYSPPAGENGNVTISYRVRNECEQDATGTITIDVNRAPSSQDVAVTLQRGENIEIPVGQLGSDDEALVISASAGAPGWVTSEPGRLLLAVPSDAAFGTVSWTATIADPGGLSATATVSVTVSNSQPTASGDAINASSGTGSTDLIANDVDPDGPNSALVFQAIPESVVFDGGGTGSIVVGGDGRTVTVATTDGLGTGTFSYSVRDPGGSVSNTATVTVLGPDTPTTTTTTEPAGNTTPVATDQSASVTVETAAAVPLDVFDADGDPLTVVGLSDPSGVVTGTSGTTLTINASRPGRFVVTYQVTDGTDTSGTATLTIVANAATTTTIADTTTTIAATTTTVAATTTTTVAVTTSTVAATTTTTAATTTTTAVS